MWPSAGQGGYQKNSLNPARFLETFFRGGSIYTHKLIVFAPSVGPFHAHDGLVQICAALDFLAKFFLTKGRIDAGSGGFSLRTAAFQKTPRIQGNRRFNAGAGYWRDHGD